jgi:hypothetical protein
MRKHENSSSQSPEVWLWSDDGSDFDDSVCAASAPVRQVRRFRLFSLHRQSGGMALELCQGTACLMGETRALFRDRLAVCEQLGVGQVLARLEEVMELPLLGRGEVGVGTHRMSQMFRSRR